MRQALVAALLASLVSSVLTLTVDRALRDSQTGSPPGSTGSELKSTLSNLERTLDGIRLELAETRQIQVPPSGPWAETTGSVETKPIEPVPTSSGTGFPREPAGAENPVHPTKSLNRFSEVIRFVESAGGPVTDEAAKSKWILRGEEEALAWFGKPRKIEVADSGKEIWVYRLATGETYSDGEAKAEDFLIHCHRGRVVDITK